MCHIARQLRAQAATVLGACRCLAVGLRPCFALCCREKHNKPLKQPLKELTVVHTDESFLADISGEQCQAGPSGLILHFLKPQSPISLCDTQQHGAHLQTLVKMWHTADSSLLLSLHCAAQSLAPAACIHSLLPAHRAA